MSKNLSDFLIGLAIPLALSAIWYGVLRSIAPGTMMRLYTTPPMKFVIPVVLVGVAVVIALVCWSSRRYAAYGALVALVPALLASLALLRDSAVK